MITNFESYTFELNQYEREILLPMVVKQLNLRLGKQKAITNKEIVIWLRENGFKINNPRFRKIIQYIRLNDIIKNLLACKKGYYISTNKSERELYIKSLDERVNSLNFTLSALKRQNESTKEC